MRKQKGISLIVLVITIIVMIILAGSIILTLSNNGIIGKASEAVNESDKANIKNIVQLYWTEAYAELYEDNAEITKTALETKVYEKIEKSKLDMSEYGVVVTTKGVKVVKGWAQDGLVVRKGLGEKAQVLNIGQTVKYTATGTDYTGEWKVIGADEYGNLLIMSATDVETAYKLGYESSDTTEEEKIEECQNEWLNGTAELDSVCAVYGKGKNAIGARSITVEDIDKITGYNPEREKYGEGEINKYGNKVTYTYNKSTKLAFSGANGVTGIVSIAHGNGFYYYNGSEFKHVTVEELTDEANDGKTIATLTSNHYAYDGTSKLSADSDAYKMIFGTSDSYNNYWIASPYIYAQLKGATYGIRRVMDGRVSGSAMFGWRANTPVPERGVRAVVTLSSNLSAADLI